MKYGLQDMKVAEAVVGHSAEENSTTNNDVTQAADLANISIEDIVQGDLIAKILKKEDLELADLEIVDAMSQKILDSEKQKKKEAAKKPLSERALVEGMGEALSNGIIALIKAYPVIKQKKLLAAGTAFEIERAIEEKYQLINKKNATDPEIVSIVQNIPEAEYDKNETRARVEQALVRKAKQELCTREAKKAGYNNEQEEKSAAKASLVAAQEESKKIVKFTGSILTNLTGTDTDLTQFDITRKTTFEERAAWGNIVESLNKALFDMRGKSTEPQLTASKKATGPSVAKNYMVNAPKELSDSLLAIEEYKAASEEEKSEASMFDLGLNRALEAIDSSKYNEETLGDEQAKVAAKYYSEHSTEQNSIENKRSNKNKTYEAALKKIRVELVKKAIELHQLNNSLDQELQCAPAELNKYLEEALTYHLKRLEPKIDNGKITAVKKLFSDDPDIVHIVNQRNDQVPKLIDIPEDLAGKQQKIREILAEIGIKEELVLKTPKIELSPQQEVSSSPSSITSNVGAQVRTDGSGVVIKADGDEHKTHGFSDKLGKGMLNDLAKSTIKPLIGTPIKIGVTPASVPTDPVDVVPIASKTKAAIMAERLEAARVKAAQKDEDEKKEAQKRKNESEEKGNIAKARLEAAKVKAAQKAEEEKEEVRIGLTQTNSENVSKFKINRFSKFTPQVEEEAKSAVSSVEIAQNPVTRDADSSSIPRKVSRFSKFSTNEKS